MVRSFDRHELIDMTVNAVPVLILLAFAVVFTLYSPWSGGDLVTALQFLLLLVPAVCLAYVTYRSGLLVTSTPSRGQEARESEGK